MQTMGATVEKLQIGSGFSHVAWLIEASAFARQDLIGADDHRVGPFGAYGNGFSGGQFDRKVVNIAVCESFFDRIFIYLRILDIKRDTSLPQERCTNSAAGSKNQIGGGRVLRGHMTDGLS